VALSNLPPLLEIGVLAAVVVTETTDNYTCATGRCSLKYLPASSSSSGGNGSTLSPAAIARAQSHSAVGTSGVEGGCSDGVIPVGIGRDTRRLLAK
jgi:hypothetical protein